MGRVIISTLATTLLVGCNSQGLIPPENPSQKTHQVNFTATSVEENGAFAEELSARKTFNIFRAWNSRISPDKYGLYWTANNYDLPGKFSLEETYWNYHYVGKAHSDYPGIQNFIREGVNWGHAAEYGKTLATDYTKPEFHMYYADLVAQRNSDVDGILLDWWHDHHGKVNSKNAVAKARKSIAVELRDKLGDDFLLVGNVNWRKDTATIDYLNGVFLELYKTPYERRNAYTPVEIDRMIDLLKYYESNLQYPKLIAFEPWRVSERNSSNQNALEQDRITPANQRLAQLFASILNVHTSNGYYLYADSNHDTEYGDHGHAWYGFYDIDIGKPSSMGIEVDSRIGIRKYEKGLLGYNYTAENVEIVTQSGTLEIPAFSGSICIFSGDECLDIGRMENNVELKFEDGRFVRFTTYDCAPMSLNDGYSVPTSLTMSGDRYVISFDPSITVLSLKSPNGESEQYTLTSESGSFKIADGRTVRYSTGDNRRCK